MARGEKSSLLSELERLREQNHKLEQSLMNVSFNDNPDIFAINKNSDTYYASVSVKEARILLNNIENQNQKINIAWEVIV